MTAVSAVRKARLERRVGDRQENMTLSRAVLGLAVMLGLSTFSLGVLADIPGPRDECVADGPGCESCWQHFGGSDQDEARFTACRDPLVAKGFKEACRNMQGAGESVLFCPENVNVQKVTRDSGSGGSCGACNVGTGSVGGALAAAALGMGLLVSRRKRRAK